MLLIPAHWGLWFPPGVLLGQMLRIVLIFLGALAMHLIWTLLASHSLRPGGIGLIWLLLGNLLLTPCTFVWTYDLFLFSQPKHFNKDRPWAAGFEWPNKDELPSVAVVVPFRNEPLEVVQLTLQSALELTYPSQKLTLVVADNSDEHHKDLPLLRQFIQDLQAEGKNIVLLHRDSTVGFKAGTLIWPWMQLKPNSFCSLMWIIHCHDINSSSI